MQAILRTLLLMKRCKFLRVNLRTFWVTASLHNAYYIIEMIKLLLIFQSIFSDVNHVHANCARSRFNGLQGLLNRPLGRFGGRLILWIGSVLTMEQVFSLNNGIIGHSLRNSSSTFSYITHTYFFGQRNNIMKSFIEITY